MHEPRGRYGRRWLHAVNIHSGSVHYVESNVQLSIFFWRMAHAGMGRENATVGDSLPGLT
jgi:hypothetical protein